MNTILKEVEQMDEECELSADKKDFLWESLGTNL